MRVQAEVLCFPSRIYNLTGTLPLPYLCESGPGGKVQLLFLRHHVDGCGRVGASGTVGFDRRLSFGGSYRPEADPI